MMRYAMNCRRKCAVGLVDFYIQVFNRFISPKPLFLVSVDQRRDKIDGLVGIYNADE